MKGSLRAATSLVACALWCAGCALDFDTDPVERPDTGSDADVDPTDDPDVPDTADVPPDSTVDGDVPVDSTEDPDAADPLLDPDAGDTDATTDGTVEPDTAEDTAEDLDAWDFEEIDPGSPTEDNDGDGFCETAPCDDATVLPGDCDDGHPYIHPGRLEVCGNGEDDDCDGSEDPDNDGDGYIDADCGGDDCGDLSYGIRPGGAEIRDGLDNDCDGVYDEGHIGGGEVIVTEIMFDPRGTILPDAAGEWFEVRNVSNEAVNLQGWTVSDADTESFVIDRPGGIYLPPLGTAVLCRNGDPTENGGIEADYEYGASMWLGNSDDEVILDFETITVDEMGYTQPTWPGDEGASMQLDASTFSAADNDLVGSWCQSWPTLDYTSSAFPANYGTPGEPNVACGAVPVAGSIEPNRGLNTGGEVVTITGHLLNDVDEVLFGTNPGTGIVHVDDQHLDVTTPAGWTGRVDVTVSDAMAGSYTLPEAFLYTGTATTLEFCNVQWPMTITVSSGSWSPIVLGRVRFSGLTDLAGQGPGIVSEVGWGPLGTDPSSEAGWVWNPAVYRLDDGVDDIYGAAIILSTTGSWSYAMRFSIDGGRNWLYCDTGAGTGDGFSTADLGQVDVI